MVARDHKSCYTHAFTCPGKSTREEEYSEQIVQNCKMFVEMFGYKRIAMKSNREQAIRAFQERTVAITRDLVPLCEHNLCLHQGLCRRRNLSCHLCVELG